MSTFSDFYIATNASNLPAEFLPVLRQRLEALDEKQMTYIMSVELKSPIFALILSISFGGLGADRFYIGHVGLGFAKLLLSWLTLGIWYIIDCFLIMGATKKANLEKLDVALMALNRF